MPVNQVEQLLDMLEGLDQVANISQVMELTSIAIAVVGDD